jgi:hypothetical protein
VDVIIDPSYRCNLATHGRADVKAWLRSREVVASVLTTQSFPPVHSLLETVRADIACIADVTVGMIRADDAATRAKGVRTAQELAWNVRPLPWASAVKPLMEALWPGHRSVALAFRHVCGGDDAPLPALLIAERATNSGSD